MSRNTKVGLFTLSALVILGLTLFLTLRPEPEPRCMIGTTYDPVDEKCHRTAIENYCAVLGVGTLEQVGYETNVSADRLGSGTWHSIGHLTSQGESVYVPLQGPPDMKAIRISAWLPTKQRYLAENYQQPTANAKIYCWLGDQRIDLTPHPVTGYSRGVEMVGAIAGTIHNPIRTN